MVDKEHNHLDNESDSLTLKAISKVEGIETSMGKFTGYSYALLGHFNGTISGLVLKLYPDIPTFQMLYYTNLLLLIINFMLMKKTSTPFYSGSPHATRILFVRGVLGMLASASLFLSYRLMPLAEAVVINTTSPIFTGIFAAIFLKEKYTLANALTCLICVTGVTVISRPSFLFKGEASSTDGLSHMIGVLLCISHAILASLKQVATKTLSHEVYPLTTTQEFGIFSCLFAGLLSSTLEKPVNVQNSYILPVVIISIAGYIAQITLTRAYLFGNASQLSLLIYSKIFFSYGFDLLILHEPLHLTDFIGTGLIICGLIVNTIFRHVSHHHK